MDPAYAFRHEMQAEKDAAQLPTPTPCTTKMSPPAAASVQQPALQKANPAEPGPTPMRPGAAPGAALSGAGLASAFGGEVLAKKAAVILPKPRVTPVQQPAVKHEEAVRAQNNSSKERGSSACAEANSE